MPNINGQLQIHTDGGPDAAEQLLAWLRDEDGLRGAVRMNSEPIKEGDLGSIPEVLTIAVTGGATVTALARTLTVWLTHRRSEITVTVSDGDRQVKLTGKRLDPDMVMRRIQELLNRENLPPA
ncbi:effector-associated constant component EACC1 [Nocardia takedensis]